jgi:methyl-accepting chemotaxis protein
VRDNAAAREQITALEQVSRRIDKIVDAITTVSIQTNMLAVNGSIEAARAGEFGKGFMVVSTDIRNLARDSSENAERIKDLVKSVQDQIVAVRRDLEETAALAAAEVEKNRAITATSPRRAGHGGRAGRQPFHHPGRGRDPRRARRGEARRRAGRRRRDSGLAAAAEAAQAAREQSKGAEELASAVEEIASLADELQNSEAA